MKKQERVGKLGAEELEKRAAPLTLAGSELVETSRAGTPSLDQQLDSSEPSSRPQTEMPTRHPRTRPGLMERI